MRIYYYAKNAGIKAGEIFKILHNNDEELQDILLTEDMQKNCRIALPEAKETFVDSFYNEYGWEYDNPQFGFVEGDNVVAIVETLKSDIRAWSRQPFNQERMFQIKWRENIIADLER